MEDTTTTPDTESTETYPPLTQEELNQRQLVIAYYTDPETVVLVVKHEELVHGGMNSGFAVLQGAQDRHALAQFLTLTEEQVIEMSLENIRRYPDTVAAQSQWAQEAGLPLPFVPQGFSIVQGPAPSEEELAALHPEGYVTAEMAPELLDGDAPHLKTQYAPITEPRTHALTDHDHAD